ncbi:MAG: phenylalanine--tRNA ligase subunit beta [Candidatus Fimenecus sp.]
MKLSKKWLNEYVITDISDQEFADKMTLTGSKVEGFEHEGADIKNIVVGKILSLEKHPDSDHLWICSVDVGEEEPIQIVTGAQNLKENDIVPVAMHNSYVHGGHHITKGKLRGIVSNGMLCSIGELGLNTNDFPYAVEDGIFVLGDDCDKTLGMDIHDAIGLNDIITEFEITSNRADCMSVIGLAREASATFNKELNVKEPVITKTHGNVSDVISVEIKEPELCYRYTAAIVENIRIKPSPRWMRERLRASGVRPINNIVDITNYVMLEYGQPMHAFDLKYLNGNKIIVRKAIDGEKITTLDEVERTLTNSNLIIADEKSPVAIAGVMGGEFSGIMKDTTTIVFESAMFNGTSVRKTAKSQTMRTESSARYEKELDANGCLRSLKRALELIELLDAGDIVDGIIDIDYSDKNPVKLPFEPEWVNNFIGIDLSAEKQKEILEKIGFKIENNEIISPSFRNDIEHQADISEEIARFYGYDKIPTRKLSGVADGKLNKIQSIEKIISETLVSFGMNEIYTYTFISPKQYDRCLLNENDSLRESVIISNPLGEDTSIMRTTAVPSMLDILSKNYNMRNESVKLFEIAKKFKPTDKNNLPNETKDIVLGIYGEDFDFYTIKGLVEALCEKLGIKIDDVRRTQNNRFFHPGRSAEFISKDFSFAELGEIHPTIRNNFGIDVPCYIAVLSLEKILELAKLEKVYIKLPKYPSVTRDLAFVIDRKIPVLLMKHEIKKATGNILHEINLFDVYEGSQIEQGKKSVAFSLKFRNMERTLTDEEADNAVKSAISSIEKLGGTLRS